MIRTNTAGRIDSKKHNATPRTTKFILLETTDLRNHSIFQKSFEDQSSHFFPFSYQFHTGGMTLLSSQIENVEWKRL